MGFELIELSGDGPIKAETLNTVIATVQQRLDLLTVLRVRYGCAIEVAGERWKTACFLPSTVESFEGSCAQQDASQGGAPPTNLWVSDGDTTRVWRCHSCGRRGDVIDLVEAADELKRSVGQVVGLSAIRTTAKLAGLAYLLDGRAPDEREDDCELVSENAPRKIVKAQAPRVEFSRARAINARAAKHWHAMLSLGPGYEARAELKRRGVTKAQREKFVLGFALSEWRSLVDALPKGAYAEAVVLGLVGRSRQGELYDRYRNRIIFPYCEPACDGKRQSVTGFAGRDLGDDPKAPKWFNSINVEGVWRKGAALLGLLQARDLLTATSGNRVAVGEGGWEVLAFDRIEVPCTGLVAAPMSVDHAHLIATVLGAEQVTIAGDGDETGRRGVITSAISLLRYGFPVGAITVIDPDDGQDPGKWGETAEGTQRLRAAWDSPAAFESFLADRDGVAKPQQQRALLACLPPELAETLAARWSMAYEPEAVAEDMTPSAAFVAALTREPSLAGALSGEVVREVLASEPLAVRALESLTFGEESRTLELPPNVRAPWLSLYADHVEHSLRTHEASPRFAGGNGATSFREWYIRGEELRASAKKAKRELAACKAMS